MRFSSWSLGFFLAAGSAGTWMVGAAGCSDDSATPTTETPDASPKPDAFVPPPPPPDSGNGPPPLDCSELDANRLPVRLACTGLYARIADKTVADGVKAYKPANEFWSDGAQKSRFVFLPPGTKIDISDWNEWSFPVGTKFWKEFKLQGKRIETRLFVKNEDKSWGRTTYRWNDDESDALGKSGGEIIQGLGPDGGPYEIPRGDQCNDCHQGRRDQILGFDAIGTGLPEATGETLNQLFKDNLLSAMPPSLALALPEDTTSKATSAIGWIHANCGSCHNDNPNALASFRAHYLVRAEQLAPTDGGAPVKVQDLDVWTQARCQPSSRSDGDGGVFDYIHPGSPETSEMSILSGTRAPLGEETTETQMPPLVTHSVDVVGHAKLDAWITALGPCP